jgi:PAS domain S-box-containing protein
MGCHLAFHHRCLGRRSVYEALAGPPEIHHAERFETATRHFLFLGQFHTYRVTHKYVNSVYMGRENGSFVRSHPRELPTRYDPRQRPWYVLGKSDPAKVAETDAYASVTTNDVNIGFVKALVDEAGVFYGVVGVDATLANLTDYMLNFETVPEGKILLIDGSGTILASPENGMRSTDIEEHAPGIGEILAGPARGPEPVSFEGERCFAFHSTVEPQGWKVAVFMPQRSIGVLIGPPVLLTIGGLTAGLILLVGLILLGLHTFVIRPLNRFAEETRHIADTSDLDRRVEIRSRDEIGLLAESYNGMIESLRQTRILADRLRIERETQYRDLVESANNIILRWLPDGRLIFINRFAQSFFGWDENEILGKNILGTIVAPQDLTGNDLTSLAADIVANPEAHARNVNENVRKDGERVWVAWANKPIPADDGGTKEILDITQLVKTEHELRRTLLELASAKERAEAADRLKSSFLATMSHELRTPLNSIIGFTGIILQGLVGPLNEEQDKQLSMVRASAQHLLSLINDVLDISKIEAGQLTVARETFDLRESIGKVVRIVQPLADKKGIGVVVDIAPGVETVRGDMRRVEQILLNIMGNAVKFTSEGRIMIVCSVGDGEVVLRVSDTGIGIKREDMERIFKPFQQLDSGLTRKYEGTGLGLSICKKLVELLGGRIWVESESGKGSVFSFSLPIEGTAP